MPRRSIKQKETNNVLGTTKNTSTRSNRLCQKEECHPWTKKEDLPGRDYKTSTKHGHPRLYPYFATKERILLDYGEERAKDNTVKNMTYRTNYNSAYTKKCDCYGVTDKLSSPHSLKYKMLFNWAEKVRSAPVRKTDEGFSEMKDRYRLHLGDETADCMGLLNDLKPHSICNIYSVSKSTQSKTNAAEHCVQKVLDPYISTQQYDYVKYSPNEIAKYAPKKAEPVALIERRKTPIYDENLLRLKFLDRFIRPKAPIVPHSGSTTEVRDNYKLPLSEIAHKKQLYCSSIVRAGATKGEVMATPAMYHTEYDHYGRNWPLSSIL